MMRRLSLTARLTLLFAAASVAVLLGVGLLIQLLLQQHFEELDREVLSAKIEFAQRALAPARTAADLSAAVARLDGAMASDPGMALLVTSSGQRIFATPDVQFPAALSNEAAQPGSNRLALWKNPDGRPFHSMSATVGTALARGAPAVVVIAMDVSLHHRFMSSFQGALWVVVIAAAIFSSFVGKVAVRRGLAPLSAIRQGASGITASRLDYRLPLEAVPVELEGLVEALNGMLSRLQDSFQRLNDFSADLAHELRTPVSNILTQTQVMISKARTAEQYREVLYSNVEELTSLSRMISDMLLLAKADHGLMLPFQEQVSLGREVHELFSFFEAVAEAKHVRLVAHGEGEVWGDRMLLRRALSNLLSNAIRHSVEQGEVRITIDAGPAGDVLICVDNAGDPITAEQMPRLFDRFYRGSAVRGGASDNAGLGLAIAKSIIGLHGGQISARSEGGVTRFEVSLPGRPEDGPRNCAAP